MQKGDFVSVEGLRGVGAVTSWILSVISRQIGMIEHEQMGTYQTDSSEGVEYGRLGVRKLLSLGILRYHSNQASIRAVHDAGRIISDLIQSDAWLAVGQKSAPVLPSRFLGLMGLIGNVTTN